MNDSALPRPLLEAAFRAFPYALTVVLSGTDGSATAMIATWAMQVSFSPPMVALALEAGSRMKGRVQATGHFSINFFPAGNTAVVKPFLKSPVSEGERIGGCALGWSAAGVPFIRDAGSSLCCRLAAMYEAGDHVISIGEVTAVEVGREGEVLTLKESGWRYYR